MKQFITLLCIMLLLPSCEHKSGRRNVEKATTNNPLFDKNLCDYSVKVIRIIDGDTFWGLTDDKKEIKYRIYAIDAPEKGQAFGQKSKQHLSDLIFGKTVGIKIQKKSDQYGRPVVWVYTPEGKDVSKEMLRAGMAWHYKAFDSTPEYANSENEARNAQLGLWADKNAISPWDFKRKK